MFAGWIPCTFWKLQEGKIEDAKENYSNGIKRLIPVLDASKDEVINSLKLVLYLNLAACQMKLKQYENVIENCTKALNINNTNTKALYRRSMALTEVNRFEQAYKDAKQGLLIEENNQAFKGQLLEIQRRTKIETDKYKKMVKNCFTEKRIDVCDKEKEETWLCW